MVNVMSGIKGIDIWANFTEEENGKVIDRMKYVRYSFLQTVTTSETHWLDRPIVPNKLDKEINELF